MEAKRTIYRTPQVNQQIEAELQSIAKIDPVTGDMVVHAEDTVEKARDPKSAMHELFTWDRDEAAYQTNLREARQLIAAFRIHFEEREITVRTLTSLKGDRTNGGGYRFTRDVMASTALRRHLLETAYSELLSVERRYEHLQELERVWGTVNEVGHELKLDEPKKKPGKSSDSSQPQNETEQPRDQAGRFDRKAKAKKSA